MDFEWVLPEAVATGLSIDAKHAMISKEREPIVWLCIVANEKNDDWMFTSYSINQLIPFIQSIIFISNDNGSCLLSCISFKRPFHIRSFTPAFPPIRKSNGDLFAISGDYLGRQFLSAFLNQLDFPVAHFNQANIFPDSIGLVIMG